jgi:hypothetical protein
MSPPQLCAFIPISDLLSNYAALAMTFRLTRRRENLASQNGLPKVVLDVEFSDGVEVDS